MENITPGDIWTVVAWVAAAIVLLGNASDRIAKAWRAAKAPNDEQNSRLDALEKWREEVDGKLRIKIQMKAKFSSHIDFIPNADDPMYQSMGPCLLER